MKEYYRISLDYNVSPQQTKGYPKKDKSVCDIDVNLVMTGRDNSKVVIPGGVAVYNIYGVLEDGQFVEVTTEIPLIEVNQILNSRSTHLKCRILEKVDSKVVANELKKMGNTGETTKYRRCIQETYDKQIAYSKLNDSKVKKMVN